MPPKSLAIIDPVGIKAGLDHYDEQLSSNLAEIGCQVKLFSNFIPVKNKFASENTFLFRENQHPVGVLGILLKYFRTFQRLRREQVNAVILHLFHFGLSEEIILRAAKRQGLNVIAIVHDAESLVHRNGSKRTKRICTKWINRIVVHNSYTRDELLRQTGPGIGKKIHIIPHGHFLGLPDPAVTRAIARKSLGIGEDEKILLFFGMIKKSKGLDLLLQAMGKLDADTRLIIAGRMRKHAFREYQQLIEETKTGDRVRSIIRYISNQEREIMFKAADAVVLPYRKVYQSAVMLMAMSYGVPVIASDIVPNAEIISNGKNGLLFHDGDAANLSERIDTLLNDAALRGRIISSAKACLREHHDWKAIATSFYSLID